MIDYIPRIHFHKYHFSARTTFTKLFLPVSHQIESSVNQEKGPSMFRKGIDVSGVDSEFRFEGGGGFFEGVKHTDSQNASRNTFNVHMMVY